MSPLRSNLGFVFRAAVSAKFLFYKRQNGTFWCDKRKKMLIYFFLHRFLRMNMTHLKKNVPTVEIYCFFLTVQNCEVTLSSLIQLFPPSVTRAQLRLPIPESTLQLGFCKVIYDKEAIIQWKCATEIRGRHMSMSNSPSRGVPGVFQQISRAALILIWQPPLRLRPSVKREREDETEQVRERHEQRAEVSVVGKHTKPCIHSNSTTESH